MIYFIQSKKGDIMFNPKEQILIPFADSEAKKRVIFTPEIRQLSDFDLPTIFRGSDSRKFKEIFNFLNPHQIFEKVIYHNFRVALFGEPLTQGKYINPNNANKPGYENTSVLAVGSRGTVRKVKRVLNRKRANGTPLIEYGTNVALMVVNDDISNSYSGKGIEQFVIAAETKPSNNVSVPIELTLMTKRAYRKNIVDKLYK